MTISQGNGRSRMTPKDAFYQVGTGINRVIFNVSKGRIFGKAFGMPLIELVTTGRRSGMARAMEGFCSRVEEGPDQGKLRVRVKTQGAATVPSSTTMVEFSPRGSFPLETPEILAGEVVE